MSDLREAQLRQEFRSEIMRGYQAALCNSDVPGWTLGDEVGKVADNLLALLAAHPVEPAARIVCTMPMCVSEGQEIDLAHIHSAPARVEITDEMVAAGAEELKHWSFPRSPEYLARSVLEAIVPFLQPQPVDRPLLDRGSVCMQITAATLDGQKGDRDSIDRRTDAVMELARPMPTREQIDSILEDYAVGECLPNQVDLPYRQRVRDALWALLGGVDESACTLSPDCPWTRPHYHRGDDETVFTDSGGVLNEETGVMRLRVDESGKS